MKIKHTDVCQEDFPTHSILYEVAKVDIALACLLAEEFGGTNQYIHQMDSVEQSVRNRQIMKRVDKLIGHSRIAKDVGLSVGRVK